ncbi:MAG: hypothetical protein ACE141_01410 [Bryobacteraceae bacterium]
MQSEQINSVSSPGLRGTLEEQHLTARDQIAAAWQLHVTRLEEQIATGWKEHVEHVIEERFRETTTRVEEAFARELESRLSDLRLRLRRDLGDRFNQLLRRLRTSASEAELHASLLDAACAFSQRVATFAVEGQMLRCSGSRDVAADASGQLGETVVAMAAAPALLSAVEGKDTVIATRSAGELSEQLAGFFGEASAMKVGVFPIVCHGRSVGLLCADSGEGDGDVGSLELLTTLAGVTLEARAGAAAPPPPPAAAVEQVVRIADLDSDWSRVPEADRALHSRAQRFARVQVAEMRLYKAQAVRAGRAQGDLYSALKSEIDAAREAYRTTFLTSCASMADYLHQELVRTLANGDVSLLGPAYPGALV